MQAHDSFTQTKKIDMSEFKTLEKCRKKGRKIKIKNKQIQIRMFDNQYKC